LVNQQKKTTNKTFTKIPILLSFSILSSNKIFAHANIIDLEKMGKTDTVFLYVKLG
jgi:hypothetical protein